MSGAKAKASRSGAAAQIMNSDERFKILFEQSLDILIVVDADTGSILTANPSATRILKYDLGTIVGKDFSCLYCPGSEYPLCLSAEEVLIRGTVMEAQQVLCSDGSLLTVDVTFTLIPWEERTAIVFAMRDATERVTWERTLQENEEQLRAITNAMPDLVCFKDAHGRWLQANDFTIDLFELQGIDYRGLTDADLANRSEFCGDALLLLGQGDRRAWEAPGGSRDEHVIATRGGSSVMLDVIRVPFFDADGGRKGIAVIGRNITAERNAQQALQNAYGQLEDRVRKRTRELAEANTRMAQEIAEQTRAEEAAQESEARFRAIFETVDECIFIKDASLRYVFINPFMEQLLGIPAEEIVGRDDEFLFGADTARHLKQVDLRVLQGDEVEEQHTRTVRDRSFTFLDIKTPMRDSGGRVTGICGISHDITDRARVARETFASEPQYPSEAMRSTMELACLAANSDSIVMLTGESGCGKDYLARFIHENSARAGGPFFSINCAAVAADIAESELFGHEVGAFTGAAGRSRGLLELAEGGTLLLNEIGEMPLPLQAKLLSFLDTRGFTRVGGRKTISVNARIVAATNRDLEEAVTSGEFRQDLFYRLNVFSIRVPPLRERLADLPVLVEQLLARFEKNLFPGPIPSVEAQTMNRLAAYSWPGNVRELRNVLERAVILARGGKIQLPADFGWANSRQWRYETGFPEQASFAEATREFKRALLVEALQRSGGKRNEAARLLGMSRHSLRRQMESVGLMRPNDSQDGSS